MRIKKWLVINLVLLLTLVMLPCAASGEQLPTYQWRLGANEVEGDFGCEYGHKLAEFLDELSDGRMKLQVFPIGTLGDCADVIELTITGELEFCPACAAWISGFIPETNVYSLPYLLPSNWETLIKVMNEVDSFKVFNEIYAEKGLELFGWTSYGWKWMSANKPLKTLDDLKNFNMRVMSAPILVATYEAWGANPTPLAFGEVYSGLQLGLIEGQENPLVTIYSMRFHEVQDYLMNPFHSPFIHSPVANKKFMESLPEADRQIVYKAEEMARDWAVYEWQKDINEECLDKMLKEKPTLTTFELTPEEQEPFKELAIPIKEIYLKESVGGKRAQEVMDAILRDVEELAKGQ